MGSKFFTYHSHLQGVKEAAGKVGSSGTGVNRTARTKTKEKDIHKTDKKGSKKRNRRGFEASGTA
jgi:hypothetical protein